MATGIRDVYLGRLRLVTFDDSFQEGIGDALVISGGSAALGARTPKKYGLTLPIHGTSTDADEYGAGGRMRRQVRGLFENALARSQGIYLNAWLDGEQNGWLMVGSGTVAYASGGVSLNEYTLTIDEVYRVASDRAYRPARRLDLADRRLSTTFRDYLGGRTSTDFANLTGGVYSSGSSFCFLPPGAVDVTGIGRALQATYPIFTREGQTILVQGQLTASVLNYEQPFTARHLGDVVVHDRRGAGNGTPVWTNLAVGGSFEAGVGSPWTATTLAAVRSSTRALSGTYSAQLTSSGAAYSYGQRISVLPNQPYTVSSMVYASNFARIFGGGMIVWRDGSGNVISSISPDVATKVGSWLPITVTATSPSNAASADVYALNVAAGGASGDVFYVDEFIVTATGAPVPYFDGSTPGCAWTGAPHASTSTGPGGWVNWLRNGSAKGGVGNWVVTGSGGTLAAGAIQSADAPWGPGNSFDVSLTGVTSSLFTAGGATPTDLLPTVPGASVYVEAMVKLVNPLPAGATLAIQVWWLGVSGASVSTVAAATLTSAQAAGSWVLLSGTVVAPANAYLATLQVATSGHAASDAIRYRLDNAVLTDATALGAPPAYNPLGYPGTRFFDGDGALAGWMGARGASVSVLWQNPEDNPGWEEAYGGEHQLQPGDVPVLSNGLVRVRAEQGRTVTAGTALAFAIDWAYPVVSTTQGVAYGGGGWAEVGRWSFAIGGSANVAAWSLLTAASLVEWTPDRAVVRVGLSGNFGGGVARHVDLYITLQRGWDGLRFEVYDSPPSGTASTGYFALFAPNYSSAVAAVGTRLDGGSTGTGAAISADAAGGFAAGVLEDWLTVAPLQPSLQPIVHLCRDWDDPSFTWSVLAPGVEPLYPSGSQPLVTQQYVQPGTPQWYFSQMISVGLPGWASPASAVRNVSGSTAQVSDGNAITGQAVTESQTAATNPTLTSGANAVPYLGTYGVWVRAKGTGSNTVTFRASAPTGGGALSRPVGSTGAVPGSSADRVWASASATYTWVYVGEIPQASITDLNLTAWVSAGTVTIDSVLAVPTSRAAGFGATFDGARDIGASYLYDSRTSAEVVQR